MAWKVSHHALADPNSCCVAKRTFLLVSHVEQQKLLLQNVKPVLRIQGLSCQCESGQVGIEEILVGGGSLRTVGTTPVPTIAPVATAGEASDSLCHKLHGTGCSRRAAISSTIISA